MPQTDAASSIAEYASSHSAASAAICDKLQAEFDAALPAAASRIWHGSPVWFIGENPIVGYSVKANAVELMFWSGQLFNEPLLVPLGKDKAAKISIRDCSGIDPVALRRWLRHASTTIFDYAGNYARKRAAAKQKSA